MNVLKPLLASVLVSLGLFMVIVPYAGAVVDLEVNAEHIRFSKDVLVAGEEVRIYAKVRNRGDEDATGYVFFYNGTKPIGPSQIVSSRAGGTADEVWVDFIVPNESFAIWAEVKGIDPEDTNSSNNEARSNTIIPVVDSDRDGVVDGEDNCPNDANADQEDYNDNGEGDICDPEPEPEEEQEEESENEVPEEVQELPEPVVEPEKESKSIIERVFSREQAEVLTESEESEIEELQLDKRFSEGVLNLSVNAQFITSKLDWATYEFISLGSEALSAKYEWDFGDGAVSSQKRIQHTFEKPGKYVVKLSVTSEDGTVQEDIQEITISFFHFANPLLVAAVVGLILIIFAGVGLIALGGRTRKSE